MQVEKKNIKITILGKLPEKTEHKVTSLKGRIGYDGWIA